MIQLISIYSYNKMICFSRLFLPHSTKAFLQLLFIDKKDKVEDLKQKS